MIVTTDSSRTVEMSLLSLWINVDIREQFIINYRSLWGLRVFRIHQCLLVHKRYSTSLTETGKRIELCLRYSLVSLCF